MTEPSEAPKCRWSEVDGGYGWWNTSCGEAFVFETAGPKENGMKFCPYCGSRLEMQK